MDLGNLIPQFISVLASAGRVMEIDGIEPDRIGERTISEPCCDIGIRIADVSFGYGTEQVLEHVNCVIAPNEIVGVVGPSGAGKTTLAYLLVSLLCPDSGTLNFFSDSGIEEATAASRRFISYVPQGNTLISGTIAENLRTGRPDASEPELMKALEIADCLSFVEKLENKLETRIGENGTGLSVGQAQRIAIARAIIKNAPILILDEATSALDADTEERVLRNLRDSGIIHTCIIITHRRSMLAYCHRAIEIKDGKVIELPLCSPTLNGEV